MGELPLIFFTLCMQTAIGTMIMVMAAKHFQKDKEFKLAALVAALLSIVGLIASFFHLGTPVSTWNAIVNSENSWISREILFTRGFSALTVLYVFLVYKKPEPKRAINIIGWAAGIVGLMDVFMMVKVYTSSNFSVWRDASIFMEFYASVIILGVAVLFLTSAKKLDRMTIFYFGIGVLTAITVQTAFTMSHYLNLGIRDEAGAAMGGLIIVQLLVLFLGTSFLLLSRIQAKKMKFTKYYVTGTILCFGLIIDIYLFYSICVSSRVGLS